MNYCVLINKLLELMGDERMQLGKTTTYKSNDDDGDNDGEYGEKTKEALAYVTSTYRFRYVRKKQKKKNDAARVS